MFYGSDGCEWCDDDLYIWDGSQHVDGAAERARQWKQYAGSDRYGQRADDEHRSVWDVYIAGEPTGGGGDRGGVGSLNPDAVYSCNSYTLGAGVANGDDWQHPGAELVVYVDVYLGGIDFDHVTGAVYGECAVGRCQDNGVAFKHPATILMSNLIGKGWSFPPQIDARGGIALVSKETELEQAILIILSTAPGQRVMRPTFGCRLQELVFQPNNSETAGKARRYVEEALGMWEPRIVVQDVVIRPKPSADNTLEILITYEIKTTRDRRSLVYPFYLIPGE